MLLLELAPLWAAAVLAISAMRCRRVLPHSPVLWPALAGLCCFAMPRLLELSFIRGVIGIVHPLTIALCALTIVFSLASTASLLAVTHSSRRPDRPRLLLRLFSTACGLAFFGLTLWLVEKDFIGLCIWAW